jgi:hypothetical protein
MRRGEPRQTATAHVQPAASRTLSTLLNSLFDHICRVTPTLLTLFVAASTYIATNTTNITENSDAILILLLHTRKKKVSHLISIGQHSLKSTCLLDTSLLFVLATATAAACCCCC